MRFPLLTAVSFAALCLGGGQALAFQEVPEAPAAEAMQILPDSSEPALQLGTPAAAPQPNAAERTAKKGGKVFGFSLLPKLDFGLELLYSQQPTELPQGGVATDDASDVTVLGKVKRHF